MTAGHAWSDWLEVGDADLDNDHHLQMRLVSSLVDALEDLDDVQNVFTNVDVPEDVMAALED